MAITPQMLQQMGWTFDGNRWSTGGATGLDLNSWDLYDPNSRDLRLGRYGGGYAGNETDYSTTLDADPTIEGDRTYLPTSFNPDLAESRGVAGPDSFGGGLGGIFGNFVTSDKGWMAIPALAAGAYALSSGAGSATGGGMDLFDGIDFNSWASESPVVDSGGLGSWGGDIPLDPELLKSLDIPQGLNIPGYGSVYGATPFNAASLFKDVVGSGAQGLGVANTLKSLFGGGGQTGGQGGNQGFKSTGNPLLDYLIQNSMNRNGPGADILGGLLEAYGSNRQGKEIADAMRYAVDKADPFASQRPTYQGMLPGEFEKGQGLLDNFGQAIDRQNAGFNDEYNQFKSGYGDLFNGYKTTSDRMFNDPSYWNNDSLLAGLNRNAVNDTTRSLSAQGYNMSGNVPMEVAQRLQNNNANYVGQQQQNFTSNANTMLGQYGQTGLGRLNSYNQNGYIGLNGLANQLQAQGNRTGQVANAAGAQFGPGSAGTIAGQMGTQVAGTGQQVMGGLGTATNAGLRWLFS